MSEPLIENHSHSPYASLNLLGKALDPEKITQILGIKPTWAFKRGDRKKNGNTWPHGLWMLESTGKIESADPIMHIKWLLEQLEPAKKKLMEIFKEKEIDVKISCFWIMSNSQEALIFQPELLNQMAALNIKVEFSIYSP